MGPRFENNYYGMQFFAYASVFIKINEYLKTQLVHIRRNFFHLLSKQTLWCHLKVHCAKIVKRRIATFLHLVECAPILHKHCTTFVSITNFLQCAMVVRAAPFLKRLNSTILRFT